MDERLNNNQNKTGQDGFCFETDFFFFSWWASDTDPGDQWESGAQEVTRERRGNSGVITRPPLETELS